MPLTEGDALDLAEAVTDSLPPRALEVTTPMGQTFEVLAYVRETTGALDALGLPDRNARLVFTHEQPRPAPGDQVGDDFVVWTAPRSTGAFLACDLRRLLPFIGWTRERRQLTGRDPATRAPLYETTLASIDAHLLAASYSGETDDGTRSDRTTGTIVMRALPTAAVLGDRLTHPDHGVFDVKASAAYGPWARVEVEAPR